MNITDSVTTKIQFQTTDPEVVTVRAVADYSGREVTIDVAELKITSGLTVKIEVSGTKRRQNGTPGTVVTTCSAWGPDSTEFASIVRQLPVWVRRELSERVAGCHWAISPN